MPDFGTPGSPNAAALQNILGASNILRVPQSENEELLQLIAQQTQTLINTLDAVKNTVDVLTSIQRYIGVTTTELADGDSTNPIVIDGTSVTAVSGDAVLYNGEDFVYNGTIWQSVPDALGALAYKSSASGSYTPGGTVSQPTFTGDTNSVTINKTTENVSGVLTGGTLPSLSYDSGTNTVTFSAGAFPTAESKNVLKDVSGTVTPSGTVSQPTFTGTQGTVTVE